MHIAQDHAQNKRGTVGGSHQKPFNDPGVFIGEQAVSNEARTVQHRQYQQAGNIGVERAAGLEAGQSLQRL